MLDIFTAIAAGKADDNGRKSFTKKALDQLEDILNLASPFSNLATDKEKHNGISMEEKMKLLDTVNSSSDKSMDGLLEAMAEAAGNLAKAK